MRFSPTVASVTVGEGWCEFVLGLLKRKGLIGEERNMKTLLISLMAAGLLAVLTVSANADEPPNL